MNLVADTLDQKGAQLSVHFLPNLSFSLLKASSFPGSTQNGKLQPLGNSDINPRWFAEQWNEHWGFLQPSGPGVQPHMEPSIWALFWGLGSP